MFLRVLQYEIKNFGKLEKNGNDIRSAQRNFLSPADSQSAVFNLEIQVLERFFYKGYIQGCIFEVVVGTKVVLQSLKFVLNHLITSTLNLFTIIFRV